MKKKLIPLINKEQSFFMAMPALVWQILFLYVPAAVILGISVMGKFELAFWRYLTLEHYATIFSPMYFDIIVRSLILAVSNALICFLFAYPVAYFLAMRAQMWKNILLLLLILPFWTNFLVQVYAWFFILERNGLLNVVLLKAGIISTPLQIMNTPLAIHLVMLFCYLPFMIMPIYTSLEKINQKLLEASHDLGATDWQTFLRVTFPLSLSGVKTGCFLVLVPSFGEFVIPSLLGGGKTMYVGSLVSYYFIESRDIFLGSTFTCVSAFVLMIVVAIILLLFRRCAGSRIQG